MNRNIAIAMHIYKGQYRRFRQSGCLVAVRGHRIDQNAWHVSNLLTGDAWWENHDLLLVSSRPFWVQKGDGLATQKGFRVSGITSSQGLLRLKNGDHEFWDLERAESLDLTEVVWTTKH